MRFAILQRAGPDDKAARPAFPATAPGIVLHECVELAPGSQAARVTFADGRPQRSARPPDIASRPLVALCIIEAASRGAAVDWLRQSAPGRADADVEIRETGCPGGLPGVDPTSGPHDPRPRFLILVKADAATEADATADAARLDAMARRNDEAVASGMLLAADGLKSTTKGTRVSLRAGRTHVLDGPFAEAKELIAGFWLIRADSLDEAVDWVCSYPYAQDAPEVDILPVAA